MKGCSFKCWCDFETGLKQNFSRSCCPWRSPRLHPWPLVFLYTSTHLVTLSTHTHYILDHFYADDTHVYLAFKNLCNLLSCLSEINCWVSQNVQKYIRNNNFYKMHFITVSERFFFWFQCVVYFRHLIQFNSLYFYSTLFIYFMMT